LRGLGAFAGGDAGEVDLGLQRFIDDVGEDVERDMGDDLDDLGIGIARALDRSHLRLAHLPALAHELGCEADGRVRFDVVRSAAVICRDLGVV
jgi:hypothetical protein